MGSITLTRAFGRSPPKSVVVKNAVNNKSVVESFQKSLRNVQLNNQIRHYSQRLPMNTVILFVPQQEAWVVERMGKYYKTLEPGLNFLIPLLDRVKYLQVLKEIVVEIPSQSAITSDNVTLHLDGVIYLKVFDPYKASYGVEDPEFAITQLAKTTTRSEIGKIALDTVFKERDTLNSYIVDAINNASQHWGIRCMRYEMRDVQIPPKVQEAMQRQVEAERKKRAVILESEGRRESDINIAEGHKRSVVLASEAIREEQINKATGEANAIVARANARATGLRVVAEALSEQHGSNAASLNVAEQYVSAFSNLAKTTNTVLLPSQTGDVSSVVTQAMSIYKNLETHHNVSLAPTKKSDEVVKDETSSSQDKSSSVSGDNIQI